MKPLARCDGNAIDRHILVRIETGNLGQFHMTSWIMALCGGSHSLLPFHNTEEYANASASGKWRAHAVDQVKTVRNNFGV
jgi:hypothetical protein